MVRMKWYLIFSAFNQKSPGTDAWRLFGRMCKNYGIAPLIEHYGCMVDQSANLPRTGQIGKAEIMIKAMPMEPDGVIVFPEWLFNTCMATLNWILERASF